MAALCGRSDGEPGTRTYRWSSAVPGGCLVIEEYADAAASAEHNRRGAELPARVREVAKTVSAELYGDTGPELREWVRTRPHATAFPDPAARDGPLPARDRSRPRAVIPRAVITQR